MASYQQQPDYRTFQIQPYERDNNAVLQTLNAKTNYYLSSAQQIKNQYQDAFSMSLTNEGNIANREAQRQQIDSQLTQITKKDLSIGDNQRTALDLFKPIMTNQNYLYDEKITSDVMSGLQRSEADRKNKGSNYLNVESVKALHNTLDDLRTADTSQKDWASPFVSDALATTYIPYDPQVDKDYQAGLQKFLKDTTSKYSTQQVKVGSDGKATGYYLSEREQAAQTQMEMQSYISENRPEQQKVLSELKAKNLAHDYKQTVLNDPINGKALAIQNMNQLKQKAYNSDVNILNETINRLVSSKLAIASTDPDNPAYAALTSKIDNLNGAYRTQLEAEYKRISPESILSDHMGYQDLASLYDRISVNSQVDALGLDRVSETLKADQSATSLQNNKDNIAARLQLGVISAETARMKALGKNADGSQIINPNIAPTTDLSGDVKITGEQKLQTLQSQLATNEDDARKALLRDGFGAVVNVNGQNTDVISAMMQPQNQNLRFDDFLNKSGLPDSTKDVLKALNGDVYAQNDLDVTSQAHTTKGAAARIMTALHEDKSLASTLMRAGMDAQNIDAIGGFGTSLQDLRNKRNNIANSYGEDIRKSVSAIPEVSKLSNEDLINLDMQKFVEINRGKLSSIGLDDSQIANLGRTLDDFVPRDTEYDYLHPVSGAYSRSALGEYGAAKSVIPSQNKAITALKEQWATFRKNREDAINNSGRTLLANGATFQIDQSAPGKDESQIDIDKSVIHSAAVSSLLNQAHTTIDGIQPIDADASAAFDKLKGQMAPFLQNMQVFDDNSQNPYLKLNLTEDGAKKLIASAKLQGIDDTDNLVEALNSTRFYVPRTELSRFGFGQQSSTALDFTNGSGQYNYNLTSGGQINFRNVGMGGTTDIRPDGKFNDIEVYNNGTVKLLKNRKLDGNTLSLYGVNYEAIQQNPRKVANGFYIADYRASLFENIVKSNHLEGDTFKIADLQSLKEKDKINEIIRLSTR